MRIAASLFASIAVCISVFALPAFAQGLPDAPGSPAYSLNVDFERSSSSFTSRATYTFWRQVLADGKTYLLVRVTPDANRDFFVCPLTFFDAVVNGTVQDTEFFVATTGATNSIKISCETISGPKTYIVSLVQAQRPNEASTGAVTFRVKSQRTTGVIAGSLIIPAASAPGGTGATTFNYSDAWYVPTESGWGVLIAHHVDTGGNIFAAFFLYGDSGAPSWYVLTSGTWNGNTFTGDLFQTSAAPGGIAGLATFAPARVSTTRAGSASLLFTSRNTATLSYTVGSVSGTKNIQRLSF